MKIQSTPAVDQVWFQFTWWWRRFFRMEPIADSNCTFQLRHKIIHHLPFSPIFFQQCLPVLHPSSYLLCFQQWLSILHPSSYLVQVTRNLLATSTVIFFSPDISTICKISNCKLLIGNCLDVFLAEGRVRRKWDVTQPYYHRNRMTEWSNHGLLYCEWIGRARCTFWFHSDANWNCYYDPIPAKRHVKEDV